MRHQYEQDFVQQQRIGLSWLWWPLAILFAGLLVYQSQVVASISGLFPLSETTSKSWLLESFIPGLALGIAEWIALWLIAHRPRQHWGIMVVTLASYLVTAPFTQDAPGLSNMFVPFYSGHPVQVMLLEAVLTGLLQFGTLAILQSFFLPLLLKVRWRDALLWILVGIIASVVAPACGVLTMLALHASSLSLLPTLAEYTIYGVITGLPLISLLARREARRG